MAKSPRSGGSETAFEDRTQADTLPDEEHPDFVAGQVGDMSEAEDEMSVGDLEGYTPVPGGPLPGPFPGPIPRPGGGPIPLPGPRLPGPRLPYPIPRPIPFPHFCTAVSGRYRYVPQPVFKPVPFTPPLPGRPILPRPTPGPIIPFNFLSITVRVDVDRYMPQKRISVEWRRLFPSQSAHVVAEVVSDRCLSFNRRVIVANIVYRDGSSSAIPGTTLTFRSNPGPGLGYGGYKLEVSGGGIAKRTYNLQFQSTKFDDVEFEVDRVSNAGSIVTAYNTGDHPNRPSNLPVETLSLETVYERSGFNVTMSPNTTVIPTSGAGSNGTWSDSEMHNAMVTYWSRFGNFPRWAMWVLYAARHDAGRSLGGIMFDDIGPNHRQGTAIFTDSFIKDAPPGDSDPAGWRRRMEFWTAVHEMGHGFNLAHSWQKALGTVHGAPGDPWIPLANEPEARSYMNYPFNVSGGQNAFFTDFRFRFSDDELIFMRHAPRRFVQMGNSNWFVNHGFEAPNELMQSGDWALQIRPNKARSAYRFLEPVTMELKLTNSSGSAVMGDPDMLEDGRHITVFLQREGAQTRNWSPMITHCHETHDEKIDAGESIYGAHMISTGSDGFLIDEPGFYKVQAAIDMGGEIVVSNVLRLYVAPPASGEEAGLAPDYFSEEVARVLAFNGAPVLDSASDVLREVVERCPDNPAAAHARVALSAPGLRDYKVLDAAGGRDGLAINTIGNKVGQAAKTQSEALLSDPDAAADTMGHIPYFGQLRNVAEALEEHGAEDKAVEVMDRMIAVMKDREILPSVIDNAERRLKRRS